MTKSEKMYELVERWKSSDLTQKQFCGEHDLKAGTFAYWVGKKKRSDEPAGGFVPIDLTAGQLSVSYPNGVKLTLGSSDLALINRLIHLV
jgi:hypothetical protein